MSANDKREQTKNRQPEQSSEVDGSTSSDIMSSSLTFWDSSSRASDRDTRDRGLAENPSASGDDSLSDYEEPESCRDEVQALLNDLMFQFLNDSVRHLCSLEGLLIQQREDAKAAVTEAEDRERSVRGLVDRFQPVMDALETQMTDFPRMEVLQDRVNVRHRVPLQHRCRACVCHDCNTSVTVDTLKSAAAAKKTLSHCNQYTAMLMSVRFCYSAVIKRLYDTQEYAHKCLQSLLWGKPPLEERWVTGCGETEGGAIDRNRKANNEIGDSAALKKVQHSSIHTAADSASDKDMADPTVVPLLGRPLSSVGKKTKSSMDDLLSIKRSASLPEQNYLIRSRSDISIEAVRSTSAMLNADEEWMEAFQERQQLNRLHGKEADLEILDTVDAVNRLPDDTWEEQVKKAQAVGRAVGLLSRLMLEELGQATAQLQDCRAQVHALNDLHRQLERAFRELEIAALELARGRCDGKFLTTGKALKDSQCRYCRCYNSPFHDDLRRVVETSHPTAKGKAKMKSTMRRFKSRVSQKEEEKVKAEKGDGPPATVEELEACLEKQKQGLVQAVAFLNQGHQAVVARSDPAGPSFSTQGSFSTRQHPSQQLSEDVRSTLQRRTIQDKPGLQDLFRAYAKIKAVSAEKTRSRAAKAAPPSVPVPEVLEVRPSVLATRPEVLELVGFARYAVISALSAVSKCPPEALQSRLSKGSHGVRRPGTRSLRISMHSPNDDLTSSSSGGTARSSLMESKGNQDLQRATSFPQPPVSDTNTVKLTEVGVNIASQLPLYKISVVLVD